MTIGSHLKPVNNTARSTDKKGQAIGLHFFIFAIMSHISTPS